MARLNEVFSRISTDLDSGVWNPQDRLPSLEHLARRYATSRSTMWRALAKLKDQARVQVNKRGAIRTHDEASVHAAPIEESFSWQRLKTRIGADLIKGVFPANLLPPKAKLSLQYSAAINTVSKSLDALVKEGFLVRNGRAYVRTEPASGRMAKSFLLIADGDSNNFIIHNDWRTQRAVEALERECARNGFEPRLWGFQQHRSDALLRFSEFLKRGQMPSGCILSLWGFISIDHRNRWSDLIRLLASHKIPTIAIDQDGALALPADILRLPQFRMLRITGARAGAIAAAALMRRKQKKLVYISGYFGSVWAKNRWEGLNTYLKAYAGGMIELHRVTTEFIWQERALYLSLLGLQWEETKAIFGHGTSPADIAALKKDWEAAQSVTLVEPKGIAPIASALKSHCGYLLSMVAGNHDRQVFNALRTGLITLAADRATEAHLESLFDRAMALGEGATWVCSDDKTALIALMYLQRHTIAVPQAIGVIGFENWEESAERQMSSYDFNMAGFVQEAMMCLRDQRSLKKSPQISEVDGYVVERRTTRR